MSPKPPSTVGATYSAIRTPHSAFVFVRLWTLDLGLWTGLYPPSSINNSPSTGPRAIPHSALRIPHSKDSEPQTRNLELFDRQHRRCDLFVESHAPKPPSTIGAAYSALRPPHSAFVFVRLWALDLGLW